MSHRYDIVIHYCIESNQNSNSNVQQALDTFLEAIHSGITSTNSNPSAITPAHTQTYSCIYS
jgi:hypothetical protein